MRYQEDDFEFISPLTVDQNKGLLDQLKSMLEELLFEEAELERPIGIRQLTRRTFASAGQFSPYGNRAIYRGGNPFFQDFRFQQLVAEPAPVYRASPLERF